MELARALAGRPRLLLMDEPLAGLAAAEVEEMLAEVNALDKAVTSKVSTVHL